MKHLLDTFAFPGDNSRSIHFEECILNFRARLEGKCQNMGVA